LAIALLLFSAATTPGFANKAIVITIEAFLIKKTAKKGYFFRDVMA
jgi:hypothetical protein